MGIFDCRFFGEKSRANMESIESASHILVAWNAGKFDHPVFVVAQEDEILVSLVEIGKCLAENFRSGCR